MTSSGRLPSPLSGTAADTLLEKALEFGVGYYDLDLRATISTEARQIIRRLLRERGGSKEELFFSLAAAVLHRLDRRQARALIADVGAYHRIGTVSSELHHSFLARAQQLSLDPRDGWDRAGQRGPRH